MFKAFTVSYDDLPPDINLAALNNYSENYLVVQMDGKTIFCRSESQLTDGTPMIMDLMELAYYLGDLDGVKHEQGFMSGRTLH